MPQEDITNLNKYFAEMKSVMETIFLKPNNIINPDIENFFEYISESDEFKKTIVDLEPIKKELKKTIYLKIKDEMYSESFPSIKTEIQKELKNKLDDISYIKIYKVYQLFFQFWSSTLEDDLFDIYENGIEVSKETIRLTKSVKKKGDLKKVQISGYKGLEGRLIPKKIFLNKFYNKDYSYYLKLIEDLSENNLRQKKLISENSFEGDIFYGITNNQNNISQNGIQKLKIKRNLLDEISQNILIKIENLKDEDKKLKKEIKLLEESLSQNFEKGLQSLSDVDIENILINEKWLGTIEKHISEVVNEVLIELQENIELLKERYGQTLNESIETFNKNLNELLNIEEING